MLSLPGSNCINFVNRILAMRKIARLVLLVMFFCLSVKESGAQHTYWQQQVDYDIDVRLDTMEKSLDGQLKLVYHNNSPDTLYFLWIHLWQNAYKNDRTAFTAQQLRNGDSRFYFSSEAERGYIHRLSFKAGEDILLTEDHPEYIDMLKLVLTNPLLPGEKISLTTGFRVKLSKIFSRSGYNGQEYAITQWYPKVALYDRDGWHPVPYLDQGEFFSNFGSYDIRISVPDSFLVAATGQLQSPDQLYQLKHNKLPVRLGSPTREIPMKTPVKASARQKKSVKENPVKSAATSYRTWHFTQDNIVDFAWFTSPDYLVAYDTIQLASGPVDLFAFYYPDSGDQWEKAIQYMKDALKFRSAILGDYPYPVMTVVASGERTTAGMEYPMLTYLQAATPRLLDNIIGHEIGHNWFQAILASNERKDPWMDEGMNTYYDNRYLKEKYGTISVFTGESGNSLSRKFPENEMKMALDYIVSIKKDQPISTPAAQFTPYNYGIIAYGKAGEWMQMLEKKLGRSLFDSCMKHYYHKWKFRHPSPADFQQSIEERAGFSLQDHFALLHSTGSLEKIPVKRKLRPSLLFNLADTDNYQYLNFVPLPAYNYYDGFMAGLLLHNYSAPMPRLRYALFPAYGFNSKKLGGLGNLQYNWYKQAGFDRISAGLSGAGFSTNSGTDSIGGKVFASFYKIVPSLKLFFRESPGDSRQKTIEWKSFFTGENSFRYRQYSVDSLYYPSVAGTTNSYINQLKFSVVDYRVLYPWSLHLKVQQSKNFFRSDLDARYFFNYRQYGGLNIRVFASGFSSVGSSRNGLQRFQPKLTGVRGNEDYTYENFFSGRSEFEGFHSRQIMDRDGGLKLRTDLFSGLQGRSERWVASINLTTTLPDLFPLRLPVKVFFDAGTYAEAWDKTSEDRRIMYAGGLQLSLFSDLLNIYAPIIYSKVFRDSFNSVPGENSFGKRISFSIDLHRLDLRRLSKNQIPF